MADWTQRAMAWIVGRDTGVSSKTIWSVMQMVEPEYADVPHDPDDFGRCYRLLKLIPEWRDNLRLLAFNYPKWAPMVREWGALTAMFEDIDRSGGWQPPYTAYERMAKRMRELEDEGLVLCGWTMTAPGCGHGPQRGYRVSREALEKALSADAVARSIEVSTD